MGTATALSAEKAAPLSYEQEQLWFLHQLMPDAAVDNECQAVILRGPLDTEMLRDSLAAFIHRHEIWRTCFPSRDGQPSQVVLAQGHWQWSVADLRELAEAERERAALRRAEQQLRQPFDLARGPLVRALLVRLGDDEHRLFLTLHNIIFDRASLTHVFLPELWELYQARAGGLPDVLAEAPQYAGYAAWQRETWQGDEFWAHLKFWQDYLAGAPTVLELPADHRRPEQRSYRGGTQPFALGAELTRGLRELSRQEQVTLRMLLTTALETLLYRYTGQEDLLVGVAVSGRKWAQLHRALGCFVNTAVLRADLAGAPSTRELLRRTRVAAAAMRDHEHVPFDAIVKELRPERSPSHPPLVQVLLAFEPQPPSLPAAWQLAPAGVSTQTSKFDLCLEVDEHADGLTGCFVYDSDLFEPETIKRMAGHWRMVLEGMVAAPSRPVTELELLGAEETAQLLGPWSTGGAVPPGPDVVALIEQQAARQPDAVAVTCAGQQLSYRELDRRANQLAQYLRQHGVAAEVLVGVRLERSLEHVIALLGILKAGGAYVPVDPEAPAERIQYVLRDTQMALLLSRATARGTGHRSSRGRGEPGPGLGGDRAAERGKPGRDARG